MKRLVLLLCASAVAAVSLAGRIDIPAQPVSPYADTEVSTNIVIHPSRTDVRDVKLHLQLDGTANNDLEVGFGRDVNTNGVLDAEEIKTVYGWRGGRYFVENVRARERIETQIGVNAHPGAVFDVHLEHGLTFKPVGFTATCGGIEAFAALSAMPPPWLFRNDWNMARVVRRGAGTHGERVRCEVGYNFFHIRIR